MVVICQDLAVRDTRSRSERAAGGPRTRPPIHNLRGPDRVVMVTAEHGKKRAAIPCRSSGASASPHTHRDSTRRGPGASAYGPASGATNRPCHAAASRRRGSSVTRVDAPASRARAMCQGFQRSQRDLHGGLPVHFSAVLPRAARAKRSPPLMPTWRSARSTGTRCCSRATTSSSASPACNPCGSARVDCGKSEMSRLQKSSPGQPANPRPNPPSVNELLARSPGPRLPDCRASKAGWGTAGLKARATREHWGRSTRLH